jgi:hypothetical protein
MNTGGVGCRFSERLSIFKGKLAAMDGGSGANSQGGHSIAV